MKYSTLFVWMVLAIATAAAQPLPDQLRLTYNRGRLEFPRAVKLPFSETAASAPAVTITDNRAGGAGYRLVLRWELGGSASRGLSIMTETGVPLAFVTPRGGNSGLPPQVGVEGTVLSPGGELVLLRADRALNQEQGRGQWLIQLNPRAFRLNLPRGTRDGTYPGTLRLLLYPAP